MMGGDEGTAYPRVVVTVVGEIDLANSAELRSRLEAASRNGGVVEVDLHRSTFFDATGLSALVSGRQTARGRGGRLLLTGVPPYLRRLLVVAELESLLTDAPEPLCRP